MYRTANRLGYVGSRMRGVSGETARYSRGSAVGYIKVTPGHTDVQDVHPEGAVTIILYVDFIITASDLVLQGIGRTLPVAGDQILWRGKLYVVTPPTQSDDCYNFTTQYRDRLRVHSLYTKKDPSSAAP